MRVTRTQAANQSSSKNRASASATARRGFTLTELLIVMAILVLLVSLVGPRILGSKAKADINSVHTQIGMFQTALERYAIDVSRFPSTEEGLQALAEQPVDERIAKKWDGSYLKQSKLPTDPWDNEYQYEYPPTHGQDDLPDIWSFGPDGEENTEDDIVSWSKSDDGSEGTSDQSETSES